MKFNLLIVCLLLFFGCAVSNNLATKNSEIDELPLEQNNEELVMTNSSEVFVLESKSRSFLIPMDSTEDSIDSLNKILSDLNSQDRIIARGDDKSMEFTFTSNFICKFLNPPAVIKSDDGITLSIEGFDDYEVYTRKEESSGDWLINIIGDSKKLESIYLSDFK